MKKIMILGLMLVLALTTLVGCFPLFNRSSQTTVDPVPAADPVGDVIAKEIYSRVYEDDYSTLYDYGGTVTNDTDQTIYIYSVQVTIVRENDTVEGNTYGRVIPSKLAPGETGYIHAYTYPDKITPDTYKESLVEVDYDTESYQEPIPLEFENPTFSLSSYGSPKVTALVTNPSSKTLEYSDVFALCKDSNGKIINICNGYISSTLSPGKTTGLDTYCDMPEDLYGSVVSVECIGEGYED